MGKLLIDYYPTLISWILKFLFFLSIYFAPVTASMISIGVFVAVDFITGVWVATRRNELITSKKMRDTVGKSIAYMVALMIAHIFELQFLAGTIPMMKIMALFIATAEIKSIYENLGFITGLNFWELIKKKLSQNEEKLNPK
jgi:phage-related holin